MPNAKANPQVVLRPQDPVVLLRLSLESGLAPTYAALTSELSMAASEIHAGLGRAVMAQLARKDQAGKVSIVRDALKPFVQHGARYAFPATHDGMTRGMLTSYAAPPLKEKIVQPNEPPPGWSHKNGTVRGDSPPRPRRQDQETAIKDFHEAIVACATKPSAASPSSTTTAWVK